MKKLLVVADWVDDSLARQEFQTAVEGFLQDQQRGSQIYFVSSSPSTIHTSFLTSQVVEIEERFGRSLETVLFVNTDPRIQTEDGVEKAKGSEFIILRLRSGMYVCGANAGYNFSMVKPKLDEVFIYQGLDKGSQFRSRDLYSRVVAHLMDTLQDDLDLEEIQNNSIPEMRGHYIGHIDNYGNIKTTIPVSTMKGMIEFGEEVIIKMNGVEKKALFTHNLFGAAPGVLVVYPGSSGVKHDPFLEVTIWRHFTEKDASTGLHVFNYPKPGMEIEIRK